MDKIQKMANGDAINKESYIARVGILKVRVNRHPILLKETEDNIRIIRVLHESMDFPQHLSRRS